MQPTEVISVNLWSTLIALCNLGLMFWIVKRFLFKPVVAMLEKRQADIDDRYQRAQEAQEAAEADRLAYEEKLQDAGREADELLKTAAAKAQRRGEDIVEDARQQAEGILRQARTEAQLEKDKAVAGRKRELVEISTAMAEKLLEREMDDRDRSALFESFLEDMGDTP